MARDQFEVIRTTGDRGQDEELKRMLSRIAALEASQVTVAATATIQVVTSAPAANNASVTVATVSGDVYVPTGEVDFDDVAADFAVEPATGSVIVSRTACTVAPAAIGTTALPGTSTHAANADHVHAGVTSVATAGLLAGNSISAQGAVTVTVKVPSLSSDPGTNAAGDMWWNTVSGLLRYCTVAGSPGIMFLFMILQEI